MSSQNAADIKKRVIELSRDFLPCDLPIGVYRITKDGDFVRCNNRARQILQMKETGSDDDVRGNICDFYADPGERIRLMEELAQAEAEGKFLEKRMVCFNVKRQKIWVEDYCKSIKDPATNEIIGYIGCLEDVTEEENYRQLFENLPVGVYKLDAENRIAQVNKATLDILGYENPNELIGIPIKTLYVDPREADRADELIKRRGYLVNERLEFLKKSGERCYISVCAYKKTDPYGAYTGREGTIMDVTKEEFYRQLREMVPVGTYMLSRDDNGREIIRDCNKAFADIFEYTMDEIIGIEVKELYATGKDYYDFVKIVTEKHKKNDIVSGIPIRAKTSKGRLMTLDVHCRLQTDGAGNILGRAGVVIDISDEVALRDLRDEMGKVLHFYSASLVTLDQFIRPVLSALSPDPFASDKVLTIDKAIEALEEPAKNLHSALSHIIRVKNSSLSSRNSLPDKDWTTLEQLKKLLEVYREQIPYPEFQLAALHDLSEKILDIYNRIEKGKFSPEVMQSFFNKAKRLERICCLIRTHQAIDTIIEIDYQVRALREFVIFQQRQPEPLTVCKMSLLVQNAIHQLYLFAKHRRVKIKQDDQSRGALVEVEARSVLRALSNLLHNAVKYSWFRDLGQPPWVSVKTFTDRDSVYVEFQNYGVPIAKEEIENELVFRFGYRGKYSGDRMRLGTGIGLTDARETARKHGGDVIIKSYPASEGNVLDYNQPFLTTATFILPLHNK